MGKKTPLYSGGNNPTVTPQAAPQRAVLPLGQRYYRSPSRYCRWAQSGTTAVVRAVLPHTSGTTAPTGAASTVKPDTKKDPSNRGGTSTKPQRYYGWGLQRYYRCGAVLPLVAPKRYYRSGPRYYRWDQRGHTEKGNEPIIEAERLGGGQRKCT